MDEVIARNLKLIHFTLLPGGGLGTDLQSIYWVLNFENLYMFLGTSHSCCIFWVVKQMLYFYVFYVFDSIF